MEVRKETRQCSLFNLPSIELSTTSSNTRSIQTRMKTSTLISMCALSTFAFVPAPTTARPMHAGIDYERYLAEKDATTALCDDWLKKHGSRATELGLMPTSEDRSSDDYEKDVRQRIFLSQLDVKKAQAANPNANFSIDVVYSIPTKDEFASKIMNSYAHGNTTLTPQSSHSRKLRTQYDFTSNSKMLNKLTSTIESLTDNGSDVVPLGESVVAAKSPVTAMSYTSATRSPKFVRHGTPTREPCEEEEISTKQWVNPTMNPVATKAPTKAPVSTKAPTTATPATTKKATQSDSVDWTTSACISPVQNQGQCGDCWAFATASAVESAQCIASGQKSKKLNVGGELICKIFPLPFLLKNKTCRFGKFLKSRYILGAKKP